MQTLDINNLAPVLITVYDRLDCLQNAINSLKQNELAKYTYLYIVSDYAYDSSHIKTIESIREYIKSICGFKKIEGIFWDTNKGSFDSINDAIRYVFSKYEKIIVFEDDILVSNRFLEYMNKALEFYKQDKRIFSIASHTHYKNIIYNGYPYEMYTARMYSPWGTGMWRDRFYSIDFNLQGVDEFLNNKKEIAKFNAISNHMLPILRDMLDKGKKYGDVIICYNMFKTNRLTLYPIKPLSVNRGHDGRGEHCAMDNIWQNQALQNDFCPKMVENIELDSKISKNLYRAFYSYKRDIIIPLLKKLGIYKITRYLYKIIFKNKN
ncbi:glycosyltransferase [Helicobacter sp. MIT 14-3879]|uniref:glycosyltransferase n=1 Tax=Helicobacter sp. MIT 14-3879 TaxID=2040649 RepID=UPI000E1E4AE6|nr:glycosyltransferase [Helicobacter sp. MIT 14-3879]RDU63998.1 glycosyl transferase [Helicobacter sp. MIT 14-3879]